MRFRLRLAAPLVVLVSVCHPHVSGQPTPPIVSPLFDLSSLEGSPFPSDRFTVADASQNTGRRVSLPMPDDCAAQASECEDRAVLNQLDGFNMQPRMSVHFDGHIDPASVTSETIFLMKLGDAALSRPTTGAIVGIDQIVWTPDSRELSFQPDNSLDQHTTYALVVTTGVKGADGRWIGVAEGFRRSRADLARDADGYYRNALRTAEDALRATPGLQRRREVAALSVFTTQSFSHVVERLREAVRREEAPTLNFGVGPGGARAVFNLAEIEALTSNIQNSTRGALTRQPLPFLLATMRLLAGAVGTVAFGTFRTPDFTTRATGHIAQVPSRTGTLAPTGSFDVAFSLTLPSGAPPARGWPVAICIHGSSATRLACLQAAPVLHSHGVALLGFNAAGHGGGPLTTLTVGLTGGTSMTVAAPGNGYDRNGDGTIEAWEPQIPGPPYSLQGNMPTSVQTTAMLLHLVRRIQAGVDVNGDRTPDLDGSRIHLFAQSYGNVPGMMAFAVEPAIRSAVFIAAPGTMVYNTQLSPIIRPAFGGTLSRRRPSLVNGAFGVTSVDGQPVPGPHYNESLPLRGQTPLVNTVPGAIAIQRYIDHRAWAEQFGSPVAFAPLLRRIPLAAVPARPFVFLAARSDSSAVNPGTTAVIRAGDFADRVLYYRHDLNFGNAHVPANPHTFFFALRGAPDYSRVALGAQHQVAAFFASDGTKLIQPAPAGLWEVANRGALPEDLLYLPRPR